MHDGDTVHLQDGRKVRLIGINTPELARDKQPEQAFAREARDLLSKAIGAHDNRVGLVYGVERHDRYKRTLAHLFTPHGENLQAQLLQQGMAAAIPHPPNLAFSDCYMQQELSARCADKGLWSDSGQFIVRASTLDNKHGGFRLVTGKIERITLSDHGIRVFIGKLMLGIHGDNRADFDETELLAMQGKEVTVRGWVQPKRTKNKNGKLRDDKGVEFYMHVRHPSAIEINQTDKHAKCLNNSNP
ncbi:MAG: thermonuclease family protein [Thiotrichales bacterium]|nr:MAG: thermonuclease family protein [Thiotrichales bacterium]